MRCLQEAENKVQWGWLFAPSCSCHNFTRKRAASFTYIRRRPFYEQPGERQKHARGTCRQHGNARVTKGKTLEGNGANSADKLVANMASFLSPAAKVNTEQRPSKTATKAAKAPGKDLFVRLFQKPFKGPSVCWQGSQLCCFVSSELHKTAKRRSKQGRWLRI